MAFAKSADVILFGSGSNAKRAWFSGLIGSLNKKEMSATFPKVQISCQYPRWQSSCNGERFDLQMRIFQIARTLTLCRVEKRRFLKSPEISDYTDHEPITQIKIH